MNRASDIAIVGGAIAGLAAAVALPYRAQPAAA
jgi:2-polyprenyl-6-methoxyphenol hydroxylase-like FAD-dependent oxidoreductase